MECGDLGMMPFDIAEVEMIRLRLIIPRHSKLNDDDKRKRSLTHTLTDKVSLGLAIHRRDPIPL
jgi:hypothetical protein